MRHLKRNKKLGRKGDHRNAMLANLVCSLIKHNRVETTLAKAKAAKPIAEKMVTLGKKGSIHHRRLAAARLHAHARRQHKTRDERIKWRENEDVVHILFDRLAPGFSERQGGYTRIIKLGERRGDAAQLAILEWVEAGAAAPETAEAPAAAETAEATPATTES